MMVGLVKEHLIVMFVKCFSSAMKTHSVRQRGLRDLEDHGGLVFEDGVHWFECGCLRFSVS
jgi:hypothetical protein